MDCNVSLRKKQRQDQASCIGKEIQERIKKIIETIRAPQMFVHLFNWSILKLMKEAGALAGAANKLILCDIIISDPEETVK